MAPSFDWWAKDSTRVTPVVIKMENPNNWSMVELDSVTAAGEFLLHSSGDKSRNKNAKQITWVLLLKAHRAAGCLTSIATAFRSRVSAVRHHVTSGKTDYENPAARTRIYSFIRVFLCLSVLLLGFEIAAYFKGWHFRAPDLELQYKSVMGLFDSFYSG